MTTLNERWRAWSPAARVISALVGIVVAVNVFAAVLDKTIGGGPSGPSSSSYATSSGGLAAYADLLAAQGADVTRLRRPLDKERLDPASTLVLSESNLSALEAATLEDFVRGGGRLVVAGAEASGVVNSLADARVRWSPDGATVLHALGNASEVTGVGRVEAAGDGSWEFATDAVLEASGVTAAFATDVDRGRVVAIADASILANKFLDHADNAAFAFAAAGAPARPVVFAEYDHGYGRSIGIGALPDHWQTGLAIAVLAVIIAMWARGKRLGPADRDDTVRPPPRVAYVEALAATIARTGNRDEGVRPVRDEARRRLLARAGLPPDASDDEVRRAATATGVPAETARALLQPAANDDDVVAVGRALASLEEKRW